MATDNWSPDEADANEYNSHLFTVRVWQEAISQTEAEWRGRLQHVPSGQVYYFRSWTTLIHKLLSMLPEGEVSASQTPPAETSKQARPDEGNDNR